MAPEVKIPVTTPGLGQAKDEFGGLTEKVKQFGDAAVGTNEKAADSADKSSRKFDLLGSVFGKLRNQAIAFVGSFLGMQAVIGMVTNLIEKLQKISELQKEIYQQSLQMSEIGQRLEVQTGTKGRQQYWAEQAVKLQQAGGLQSPEAAQQMMVSMDIAFGAQGGIKNQAVQNIAKQLAPFVGAAGLGGEDVAKLFEFAGSAKIAPTADAYKEYFAKILAGFTTSKATNFGQFMVGLQKGGTGLMAGGASLDQVIGMFAGTRAVTANESLAATLLEQAGRISSGAYEQPRRAMERFSKKRWQDIAPDERVATLLKYIDSLPAEKRAATMAQMGFPVEVSSGLSKLASQEGLATMAAAQAKIAGTDITAVDTMSQAYQQSMLGQSRIAEAEKTAAKLKAGPAFGGWVERLAIAKTKHDIIAAQGKDSKLIPDDVEPTIMALEQLSIDFDALQSQLPPESREQAAELNKSLKNMIRTARYFPTIPYRSGMLNQIGTSYSQAAEAYQGTTIINDHSIKYYPRVGEDTRGPRFRE